MPTCHLCRQHAVRDVLDFGAQPVTNRFLHSAVEPEYTHPLAVGVCSACGTVQLGQPMPASEVRPRFDWISYNEPESHLDQLADDMAQLPGLTPQSVVCGISYKDDSTLRRLRERGFQNTWTLDLKEELGIEALGAGIETIQDHLTPERTKAIAARKGRPQLVIMRHILEHSHDIHRVLTALNQLVAPGGYLVFEMPDACRALEKCDYSTVWEEHIFYFTPATLQNGLAQAGFEVAYFRSFPYTLEDSLVVIVRSGATSKAAPLSGPALATEVARARTFLENFAGQKQRYQRFFDRQQRHGKTAFLGAGHLSAALLNFFDLQDQVAFVVDDHPKKQGLFMPGSRLPIVGSQSLVKENVKLCCMSVRPEIEDKVVEKNRPFVEAGGTIRSIFPDSRYALAI